MGAHRVKSLKGWRKPEPGSAEAVQEQGWRMIKGDMFAKRMAPCRREEASRLLEQAAERGNARAMCNLAALLALHERERAFLWAERAVETGQAAALVQMALLMNANDFRHAATLLDRAAEQARELPLARRIAVRTALRTLGLGNSLDATWRRAAPPRAAHHRRRVCERRLVGIRAGLGHPHHHWSPLGRPRHTFYMQPQVQAPRSPALTGAGAHNDFSTGRNLPTDRRPESAVRIEDRLPAQVRRPALVRAPITVVRRAVNYPETVDVGVPDEVIGVAELSSERRSAVGPDYSCPVKRGEQAES